MAIRIKATDLPAVVRGRGTGQPFVRISESGQISFSTEISKKMGKHPFVDIVWDSPTRILAFTPMDTPVKGATDADMVKLGHSDKIGTNYLSGAGLLRMNTEKVDIGYDFKTSGSQSFTPKISEKGVVSIVVPKGSLTPVVKAERKPRGPGKKEKAASAAAGAGNGGVATSATVAKDSEDEGVELEIAE